MEVTDNLVYDMGVNCDKCLIMLRETKEYFVMLHKNEADFSTTEPPKSKSGFCAISRYRDT